MKKITMAVIPLLALLVSQLNIPQARAQSAAPKTVATVYYFNRMGQRVNVDIKWNTTPAQLEDVSRKIMDCANWIAKNEQDKNKKILVQYSGDNSEALMSVADADDANRIPALNLWLGKIPPSNNLPDAYTNANQQAAAIAPHNKLAQEASDVMQTAISLLTTYRFSLKQ